MKKDRETVLVLIGTGLLVLVSLSLANVNLYLRAENRVLLNNFIQITDKVQELENEMKIKRIPPISPEKAVEYLQARKLNLAPTRYNLENKGFITKNGRPTCSSKDSK